MTKRSKTFHKDTQAKAIERVSRDGVVPRYTGTGREIMAGDRVGYVCSVGEELEGVVLMVKDTGNGYKLNIRPDRIAGEKFNGIDVWKRAWWRVHKVRSTGS